MKTIKIIFLISLLFVSISGYSQCGTGSNFTGKDFTINGVIKLNSTCAMINFASSGYVIPYTAGGTGLATMGTFGQMLRSNGSNLYWFSPDFLGTGDTNTVVMTRHDADSAIAIMQTDINTKISTEVDPTIPSYSKTLTAFSIIKSSTDLLYRPIGYVPSWSDVTSKPTTLFGFGITDGQPLNSNLTSIGALSTTSFGRGLLTETNSSTLKTTLGLNNVDNTSDVNKPVSTAQAASIATKFTIPTGTTSQYLRGDGSLATFPTIYTFTGSSSQYTKGDGTYGTLPTAVTPTYNYVTRTPGTSPSSYTPSTTQPYRVYYTIEIACTASIGSNSDGSVILQYYNGTSWVNSSAQIRNSNTVTLAVALNSVTIQKSTISEEFPANTQLRLLSSTTGTTSITWITGKEVLY